MSDAGELYCWGKLAWYSDRGGGGEIEFNANPMPRITHAPNRPFAMVATGLANDCALLRTGQVFCTGRDFNRGQLGRDTLRTCSPSGCGLADSVDTPERFRSLVGGQEHWCALTRDGRAFCWGLNDQGQAGVGTRSAAVWRPTPVAGNYRFVSLTAGWRHTCGITVGGETLCWGANASFQLGINTARRGCLNGELCTMTPAPIDEPRRFAVVKAGVDKTCGVTVTGALYCWGAGYSRRDGDKPLALTHIGATFAFSDVSPGSSFTCAIATGGRAYCWKEQATFPMGQSLVTWGCTDAPVCLEETPLSDDLRFRALASGFVHACGITTDGEVYCWGLKNPYRTFAANPVPCMTMRSDLAQCSASPVRIGGNLNLFDAGQGAQRGKKRP